MEILTAVPSRAERFAMSCLQALHELSAYEGDRSPEALSKHFGPGIAKLFAHLRQRGYIELVLGDLRVSAAGRLIVDGTHTFDDVAGSVPTTMGF